MFCARPMLGNTPFFLVHNDRLESPAEYQSRDLGMQRPFSVTKCRQFETLTLKMVSNQSVLADAAGKP
jgi:hypothetical protein